MLEVTNVLRTAYKIGLCSKASSSVTAAQSLMWRNFTMTI